MEDLEELESSEPIEDEDVAKALQDIANSDPDDLIRPVDVVEAARDEDSPLHKYFEWNNGAAAHAYRLVQARNLIRKVQFTRGDPAPQVVNITIVHADTGEKRRGYVPTERAVAEPDLRAQILQDARRGIEAYRNRLATFEQMQVIVGHLDAALDSMKED
jgi:hypothetical protein